MIVAKPLRQRLRNTGCRSPSACRVVRPDCAALPALVARHSAAGRRHRASHGAKALMLRSVHRLLFRELFTTVADAWGGHSKGTTSGSRYAARLADDAQQECAGIFGHIVGTLSQFCNNCFEAPSTAR